MRIDRADGEAELLGPPISNREIVKVVAGDFEVRLAQTAAEIDAAQALRFRIFYEEMAAHASPEMAATRRDFDAFDEVCDHLLVLDRRRGEGVESIVGTYRLIRRAAAAKMGRFYSSAEYDIQKMIEKYNAFADQNDNLPTAAGKGNKDAIRAFMSTYDPCDGSTDPLGRTDHRLRRRRCSSRGHVSSMHRMASCQQRQEGMG